MNTTDRKRNAQLSRRKINKKRIVKQQGIDIQRQNTKTQEKKKAEGTEPSGPVTEG